MIKSKLTLLSMLSLLLLTGCSSKTTSNASNSQPPVCSTEKLTLQTIQVDSKYPVTLHGASDFIVRPKIAGFITDLLIDEGSKVKKGDILFILDDVEYRSAVDEAKARLDVALSNEQTAKLTWENKSELAKSKVVGTYDLQLAENSYTSAKALTAQAKAALVKAENNLAFTRVRSQTSGVVGEIPYRLGSYVTPQTALTVVSDLEHIHAHFSINEKEYLTQLKSGYGFDKQQFKLLTADGSLYPHSGELSTISGVVDQQTGGVNVRVAFPNPNYLIRSGASGTVLFPVTYNDVLLVPQKYTYEVQDKKFVYRIDEEQMVHSVGITIAPVNDGVNYIVLSGLSAGDEIVTQGMHRIREGVKIEKAQTKN